MRRRITRFGRLGEKHRIEGIMRRRLAQGDHHSTKPSTLRPLCDEDLNGASAGEKVDPNDIKPPQKTFRTALPQILATMAKNLILLTYGMTLGFPTIVIPALSEAPVNATLHLSKEEASWFGSINLITVPLGCLVSGVITQPFGRKRSMQFLTIPFFAVWIMFYYADSVAMLYASLALTGLAGGLLEAPVLTYVAEITQPHLRGFLSATSSLSVIIGLFTQFLMGTFIDWRTLSLVNSAFPIMAFIALCFIPESPHWLIGKARLEDAEKALCWLRGWRKPQQIKTELDDLVKAVRPDLVLQPITQKTKSEDEDGQEEQKQCCKFQGDNYKKPTFIKPFFLIAFCFFAGHFCGMTTLTTFAVPIFSTLGSPIDKYYATMILGIVQMVATLSCVLCVHSVGKRPIAFVSTVGSFLSFGMIGLYAQFYLGVSTIDDGHYFKEHFGESSTLSWIPLVGLLFGAFFAYMGIRLLPWVLIGEVYPPEIRAFASGTSGAVGYIFGFLSNKTFYGFIDTITLPGVYIFYSLVALSAFILLYFVLPETEGWTLYEIEQHFAGDRNLIKAGRRKASIQPSGFDNPTLVVDEVSKL